METRYICSHCGHWQTEDPFIPIDEENTGAHPCPKCGEKDWDVAFYRGDEEE